VEFEFFSVIFNELEIFAYLFELMEINSFLCFIEKLKSSQGRAQLSYTKSCLSGSLRELDSYQEYELDSYQEYELGKIIMGHLYSIIYSISAVVTKQNMQTMLE